MSIFRALMFGLICGFFMGLLSGGCARDVAKIVLIRYEMERKL